VVVYEETLMGNRVRLWSVLAGAVLLAGPACVLAADPPASAPAPSKEQREKMAVLHEQMAVCLRSNKPLTDCRAAMMKGCQTELGEACPSMMGRGMMGRSMMQGQSSSSGPK
jgi:hypothetical protein